MCKLKTKKEYARIIQCILSEYPALNISTLSRKYNVSRAFIYLNFKHNGIKLDGDGRFKKGHIPYNKGRNITDERVLQKISNTYFKKGCTPANTLPIGTETSRSCGYMFVKISNSKWIEKHKYIYCKHHNIELKKSDVIRFKDGNKRNFHISNLELVTKIRIMIENAKHKYRPENYQTRTLIAQINSRIKKLEKINK